jgi:hypothetical protein
MAVRQACVARRACGRRRFRCETRDVTPLPGKPGTHYYWVPAAEATTVSAAHMQLSGAIVVDPRRGTGA